MEKQIPLPTSYQVKPNKPCSHTSSTGWLILFPSHLCFVFFFLFPLALLQLKVRGIMESRFTTSTAHSPFWKLPTLSHQVNLTPDVSSPLSPRLLILFIILSPSLSLHQCTPAEEATWVQVLIPVITKGSLWAMTQRWEVLPAWRHVHPASSRSWPTSPTKQGRTPGWCAYSSSAAGECVAQGACHSLAWNKAFVIVS